MERDRELQNASRLDRACFTSIAIGAVKVTLFVLDGTKRIIDSMMQCNLTKETRMMSLSFS